MIVIDDKWLNDLPLFNKEQYEKLKTIAELTGLSTKQISKIIIKKHLRTEWKNVVQMLIRKYFDKDFRSLTHRNKYTKRRQNNEVA